MKAAFVAARMQKTTNQVIDMQILIAPVDLSKCERHYVEVKGETSRICQLTMLKITKMQNNKVGNALSVEIRHFLFKIGAVVCIENVNFHETHSFYVFPSLPRT